MAHGFLCRHCGYQEAPHSNWSLLAEVLEDYETTAQPGYAHTIISCPGFDYKDEDMDAAAEADEGDLATGGPHEGCH